MTEFRHDPDSLADRLDQLLPPDQPDQIGTDDDPLIETAARFASAPPLSLSPEAMARIQAQIMQEQVVPQPAPLRMRLPSSGRLALVAALTVLVIAGTVFAAHELGITLIAPDVPTATSTRTHTATMMPTQTSTPSARATDTFTPIGSMTPPGTRAPTQTNVPTTEVPHIPVSPSSTERPSFTHTATPEQTATFTDAMSPTLTNTSSLPSATATPTSLPVTIIIEGPVQAVDGNIITIHDVDIEMASNDPVLSVVQIGDIVRVEGDTIVNADTLVIVATSVVIVNLDGFVDLDGTIWRDTGDCSNPPPPTAPAPDWRARCEGARGGDTPPQEGGTVVICHYAQGESGERETLTIEWSAWVNEHNRHGDTLGPCP